MTAMSYEAHMKTADELKGISDACKRIKDIYDASDQSGATEPRARTCGTKVASTHTPTIQLEKPSVEYLDGVVRHSIDVQEGM